MTKGRIHPSLGLPGDEVIYTPNKLFPSVDDDDNGNQIDITNSIKVRVPGAEILNIFAHRQWRAGMLLSDLIFTNSIPINDKIVCELGAGTGLPSISSVRFGKAKFTLSTDYDSVPLINTLRENVRTNISENEWQSKNKVRVIGHTWGQSIEDVEDSLPGFLKTTKFDIILMADCIWDALSHSDLIKTITHILIKNKDSRIFMVSGLHTGREKITNFIRKIHKAGLQLFPLSSDSSQWPLLDEEEKTIQTKELERLKSDKPLQFAPEYVLEFELSSYEDEESALQNAENNDRQWRSHKPRLTGKRRTFVEQERPEERKEVNGVHLRNRWITFLALGWQEVS